MAHYTTQLRSVLESFAGYKEEQDFSMIDEIIEKTHKKVFTKPYNLFNEDYKSVIESKILYHYYMREIGAETVGLWRYYMNRTMSEIMPYYNELYKSAQLDFDPFLDVDYTREGDKQGNSGEKRTGKITGTEGKENTNKGSETLTNTSKDTGTIKDENDTTNNTTVNETTSENNKDKFSDTPQNGLANVENGTYLTTYRNVTNDAERESTQTDRGTNDTTRTLNTTNAQNGTRNTTESGTETINRTENTTGTADINTTDSWLERIHGKQGTASYSAMLMEYRNTILNIDEQVIKQFEKCFFGLVGI